MDFRETALTLVKKYAGVSNIGGPSDLEAAIHEPFQLVVLVEAALEEAVRATWNAASVEVEACIPTAEQCGGYGKYDLMGLSEDMKANARGDRNPKAQRIKDSEPVRSPGTRDA